MLRTIALLFTASFAILPAQTCIYTWGTDPAGTLPPRSSGRTYLPMYSGPVYYRTQLLLPETLFGRVPLRIDEMSIPVKESWRRDHYGHLILRMAQTTIGHLTTSFATNITSPLQDVIVAHDYSLLEGVGPTWVPLGMQQPFLFLPGHGDLLVDLIVYDASTVDSFDYQGLAEGWSGERLDSTTEPTIPATGSPNFSMPRFRFCVDKAEATTFGLPCGGSTNTPPLLGLQGAPVLGGSTTFWLNNAPANRLAFLALGFDNSPPYPVDLGPLGAGGCRQYFQIELPVAVTTDALGLAQRVLSIPNNTGLAGANVLGQFFVLSPASNAAGLLTSDYGRLLLGH